MQSENQNNWQQISDRLDGLESLPGEEPVNRELAWKSVRRRLHPARKKAAFRWVAAALFLGAGGFGIFRHTSLPAAGRGKDIVATAAKTNDGSVRSVPAGRPAVEERPLPPVIQPAVANKKNLLTRTYNRRSASAAKTVFTGPGIQPLKKISAAPPVNASTGLDGAATPDKQVATAPAAAGPMGAVAMTRKPLRVVHLNDLEEPALPESGADNVSNNPVLIKPRFLFGSLTGPAATTADAGLTTPRRSFFRINLDR